MIKEKMKLPTEMVTDIWTMIVWFGGSAIVILVARLIEWAVVGHLPMSSIYFLARGQTFLLPQVPLLLDCLVPLLCAGTIIMFAILWLRISKNLLRYNGKSFYGQTNELHFGIPIWLPLLSIMITLFFGVGLIAWLIILTATSIFMFFLFALDLRKARWASLDAMTRIKYREVAKKRSDMFRESIKSKFSFFASWRSKFMDRFAEKEER